MGVSLDAGKFKADVVEIERFGFDSLWLPDVFGQDPFVMHAVASQVTERIDLGTSVAVAHPRHPVSKARQAITLTEVSGRRFMLGVGPSHQPVIETMYGLSYARPAARMSEYVQILRSLADSGSVAFEGEFYSANTGLDMVAEPPGFDVLLAALAPRMLSVAGEYADGVILWMSMPPHIRNSVIPRISEAAQAAGRDRPRVVAGYPVCVTHDAAGAREYVAKTFAIYGQLPNYRRILDEAGVTGPEEVAIVGDVHEVADRLHELCDLGIDEVWAAVFAYGDDSRASVAHSRETLMNIDL